MNGPGMIGVVIVDDSRTIRSLVTEIVSSEPGMRVLGAAPDPLSGEEMIRQHRPDVVLLDVEMPGSDGLVFLERLMRTMPLPVVMLSALTTRGSDATLRALELGAVDFITKPVTAHEDAVVLLAREIVAKVRVAAGARSRKPRDGQAIAAAYFPATTPRHLLAIGASTGGIAALTTVLAQLPLNAPPTLVVQHMPVLFTRRLAERLDQTCEVRVKEGEDGERLRSGYVYIAPGGEHVRVHRAGDGLRLSLDRDLPVNFSRPSVDVLFASVAATVPKKSVGVLLTGMGKDGARGLLQMRQKGAYTITQDESSSLIYGMPGAAVALDASDEIVPLADVAARIGRAFERIVKNNRERVRLAVIDGGVTTEGRVL